LKTNFVNMVNLIRSIQRAEGNPECYGRSNGRCHEVDCEWRRHCLETPPENSRSESSPENLSRSEENETQRGL
jgi:hypothetical protein